MQLATKFVGTLLWIAAATFILAASAASAQTYPPNVDSVTAGTSDDTPDAGDVVQVFGTVVDDDGNPVEGAEVTFTISSDPGGSTFSNGNTTIVATTNADGIATVTLNTSNDEGAIVVQVASGGVISQVTITTGAPQALSTGVTPTGNDVSVPLAGGLSSPGGIELSFPGVSGGGTTTVTKTTTGPSTPTGLQIIGIDVYYNISTTATFSGLVTVCIAYDETQVAGQESDLKLMHDDGSGFTDITISLDTTNDIICGETATLSPFAIMEPVPSTLPPTGGEPLGQGGGSSTLMAVAGIAALIIAGGGLIAFRKTSDGA